MSKEVSLIYRIPINMKSRYNNGNMVCYTSVNKYIDNYIEKESNLGVIWHVETINNTEIGKLMTYIHGMDRKPTKIDILFNCPKGTDKQVKGFVKELQKIGVKATLYTEKEVMHPNVIESFFRDINTFNEN